VHENRLKNLGAGRGRVHRIALRTPDGKQINLLAISTSPLEQLVGFLMGNLTRTLRAAGGSRERIQTRCRAMGYQSTRWRKVEAISWYDLTILRRRMGALSR
jgi:hypothetical protein